jgi:5'-3' exonuclease
MMLIDLNQVLLGGLMAQIATTKTTTLNEDLIRHMVLNIIRSHMKKFRKEYGEVVICCDNRKYWRKEIFTHYKANRKKNRDKSELNWDMIFEIINKIKEEIRINFPYKMLDVDRAEADDIIGTLVPRQIPHENILILSSDGDFLQLQAYNTMNFGHNVKQYNPVQKKFIISKNPYEELHEKIIRGDSGDGIPNILSPGDTLVRGIRQRVLTEARINQFIKNDAENYQDETAKSGYYRNRMLIDLRFIPTDIKENIINTYEETPVPGRGKLLNYFIQMKLRNLIEVIDEF